MRRTICFSLVTALLAASAIGGTLSFPVASEAAQPVARATVTSLPEVTLGSWAASSRNEKMAFLLGIASILELEREWQGSAPLGIERSLNQNWTRGLAGVTLGDMAAALDKVALEHPDKKDKSVLEVLGRLYIRPSMTPAEKENARIRYQQIHGNR